MNSVLEINGKKLHAISDAVSAVSYSRDHITRLARERKILATLIGKQWYVDLDSLKNYEQVAKLEQQVRTERLSAERKRELTVKQAVASVAKRHDIRVKQARTSARMVASAICLTGLLSGVWLHAVGVSQFAAAAKYFSVTSTVTTGEVVPPVTPVFFNEDSVAAYQGGQDVTPVTQFATASTGVFLLPEHSTTTEPTELFSDPVAVVETATGQAFVKVDANGVPYGEEIPFVVVPVPTNVVPE